MARSVNKVILVGNVGKEPEFKVTPSGVPIVTFSLATSERVKDKNSGEWKEQTEWHLLKAFQRTAEIVRDYVKKGAKLYVEGSIRTSTWDDKQTGQKRYMTEILVNQLVLLSGRDDSSGSGGYSRSNTASYDQRSSSSDDLAQSAEITDDDIPF